MGYLARKFSVYLMNYRSNCHIDNLVSVTGVTARKGELLQINGHTAWVYAVYRDYIKAAVLSGHPAHITEPLTISRTNSPLCLDLQGETLKTPFSGPESTVHLMPLINTKPSLRHRPFEKTLWTGYCAIDLSSPLACGHSVLFAGKKGSGKLQVAISAAQQFTEKDDHFAIFGVCNPAVSSAKLSKEIDSPRCTVYGASVGGTEVLQYFVNYYALGHALALKQQGKQVLLVLNDLLAHAMLEKVLFDYEKLVLCI